jgi:hypothetical protein
MVFANRGGSARSGISIIPGEGSALESLRTFSQSVDKEEVIERIGTGKGRNLADDKRIGLLEGGC